MSKEDQIDENPKSASRSNSASQRWSLPFSGNTENDCNPYLAAGSAVKRKEMKDKRIKATNKTT